MNGESWCAAGVDQRQSRRCTSGLPMPSFVLPLPPCSKNHAKARNWYTGNLVKRSDLVKWEGQCRLLVGGWVPPAAPLRAEVNLRYPKGTLHRWGVDGRISMILDIVCGARGDEWIDELHVWKTLGDGWCTVRVEALASGAGEE